MPAASPTDLGMRADFLRIAKKFDSYQGLIEGRGARWITTAVSVEAKKGLLAAAKAEVGSDGTFSGWRRKSSKRPNVKSVRFRAGFELISDHKAEFKPKPNGLWKVLEIGRDPGFSRKRGTVGRRYGRAPGKGVWRFFWNEFAPLVPNRVEKYNRELLKKVF